jgi:hypothetical protein
VADVGIKKITIPKASLPSLFGPNSSYIIRYRFISDDKNRTSHWSPQHEISSNAITQVQYSASTSPDKNVITLVWNLLDHISSYDVFVSWDSGAWEFLTTTSTNSLVTMKKAGKTSVKFSVQVSSFPRQQYDNSNIFVTDTIDLVV